MVSASGLHLVSVPSLLQCSCSWFTPLSCTQPQLSLTTCPVPYCARYQRSRFAVNATSLHGRDLEGFVRSGYRTSGKLRHITGAAGGNRRGRAPLTSLLLVISSLQVSIPAIGSPATTQPSPMTFFFSSRESRPHEHCYKEHIMIRSSNVWLPEPRSYTAGSLGTLHTGKQASFQSLRKVSMPACNCFDCLYHVHTYLRSFTSVNNDGVLTQWCTECTTLP